MSFDINQYFAIQSPQGRMRYIQSAPANILSTLSPQERAALQQDLNDNVLPAAGGSVTTQPTQTVGSALANTAVGQAKNYAVGQLENAVVGGGSGAAAGEATGLGVAGIAPYAGPVAGAAAAYGGYDAAKKGDTKTSAGYNLAAFGDPFGLSLAATVGEKFLLGQSKHTKERKQREGILGKLSDAGLVTEGPGGSFVTLADGSQVNLAPKGVATYNTDLNNPNTATAVGDTMLLGNMIGGTNQKARSDFNSMYANAAMSKGDAQANIKKMYEQFGISDRAAAQKMIDSQVASGLIKPSEKAAYENAMNGVFGKAAQFSQPVYNDLVQRIPNPTHDNNNIVDPGFVWTGDGNTPSKLVGSTGLQVANDQASHDQVTQSMATPTYNPQQTNWQLKALMDNGVINKDQYNAALYGFGGLQTQGQDQQKKSFTVQISRK